MSRPLTGSQRSLVRKKLMGRAADPSEVAGELNIVPFLDIVMNIIMFLLATTQAVLAIGAIEVQSQTRGTHTPRSAALGLSVTLTPEGILVAGSGGKLAPGCAATAEGRVITVPMSPSGYDWAALTSCAARVKSEFGSETQVIVGADPTVEYEQVIHAMDALRNDGSRSLFPEVLLSACVR